MSEYDLTAWWAPLLAFAAGIVAFASPCVLPLVPGYLFVVTAAGEGRGSVPSPARRPNALPIILFVAGFSVVFTSLGAFAGVFVPIVRSSFGQRVAGLVVVGVGVFLLLYALRVGSAALYVEARPLLGGSGPAGPPPSRSGWRSRRGGRPASDRCSPPRWRSPRRSRIPREARCCCSRSQWVWGFPSSSSVSGSAG
jgi:cytochrome c biogenesis protein CcdA